MASVTEDNKNLVRRVFQEFWNGKQEAIADDLYAAAFIDHVPGRPPELPVGPEGFKRWARIIHRGVADAQYTIDDMVAAGDTVVTRWSCDATHQGDMLGIPVTGKRIHVTGITIDRITGGHVVESWTNYDALGILQQLGVVAPPGHPG